MEIIQAEGKWNRSVWNHLEKRGHKQTVDLKKERNLTHTPTLQEVLAVQKPLEIQHGRLNRQLKVPI